MARYDTYIDLSNRNVSHTQIVELVGAHKKVLDVGCATGYVAAGLMQRNCQVWGVDIDAEAAEQARPYLEQLVIADLENEPLTDHFEKGSFDAVVFGDVLEHIVDPKRALRDAVSLLAEGGRIVVSIPNVTHGSLRLALLQGNWRYTTVGLLDETHVRFFDRAGVASLMASAGLTVEALRGVMIDPLASEVAVDTDALPAGAVEWVRSQPDSLVYQFVASARLTTADDTGELPDLVPAVPVEEARIVDEHARTYREQLETIQHVQNLAEIRAAQVTDLRHRLLTTRDHIIGLEAQAASDAARAKEAKALQTRAERRLKATRRKLVAVRTRNTSLRRADARLKRQVREARAAERALRGSRSYRLGRALTSPLRILRRGA